MINRHQLTKAFINSQRQARIIETISMIFFIFSLRIIEQQLNVNFSLLDINLGDIDLGTTDSFILTSRIIAYSISLITTIFAGKIIGYSQTKWSLFLGGLALVSIIYEIFRLLIYLFTSLIFYRIYIDIPLFVLIADWLSFQKLKALSDYDNI
jgi:hypothetical protein